MKIAITSDTHFGDETSQLASLGPKGKPILGPKYEQFRSACGTYNDYLIMLGDIIDVAIEDYRDAYSIAQRFFRQVAADNITQTILYVPGNHDYDIWHTVEYQTNIINRVKDKKNKRDISMFKMSVPAVLDDRQKHHKYEIFLGNVTRRPAPQTPYGGLFLDALVDDALQFYVAFPNVYFITDSEECILMTHGQYFQLFWSLLSEWAPSILKDDLKIEYPPLMIKNLAHLNFPLSQLASSGVGQAGPLSEVIRDIQYDFKDYDSANIMKYVNNLENRLKKDTFTFKWYKPAHWLIKIGLYWAKKGLKNWIEKMPPLPPRKDSDWEYKPATHQIMTHYYRSSSAEINILNRESGLDIPLQPKKVIFGHSHRPIGLNEPERLILKPLDQSDFQVPMFNTGGWLIEERSGEKKFNGIEIITYETGQGMRSVRIDD